MITILEPNVLWWGVIAILGVGGRGVEGNWGHRLQPWLPAWRRLAWGSPFCATVLSFPSSFFHADNLESPASFLWLIQKKEKVTTGKCLSFLRGSPINTFPSAHFYLRVVAGLSPVGEEVLGSGWSEQPPGRLPRRLVMEPQRCAEPWEGRGVKATSPLQQRNWLAKWEVCPPAWRRWSLDGN